MSLNQKKKKQKDTTHENVQEEVIENVHSEIENVQNVHKKTNPNQCEKEKMFEDISINAARFASMVNNKMSQASASANVNAYTSIELNRFSELSSTSGRFWDNYSNSNANSATASAGIKTQFKNTKSMLTKDPK